MIRRKLSFHLPFLSSFRLRGLCALLLCVFCLGCLAGAEDAAAPIPFIQDDAGLLTAEEEETLYQDMLPLCTYGTPMFWTTEEAFINFERQADDFYHQRLGRGQSGVLFVINMGVRQLTIFADGEIYRTVTNDEAETITDNVYRLAREGDYYACASSAFSQVKSLLQGERIARPMKIISNALLALVLALLGVYLYIRARYETRPKAGKIKGAALPVTAAGTGAAFVASMANRSARMTKQTRTDISSSSGGGGGGGHGGGGFSGGGGGGSSGGGGSHGF
ncbi:MAG: TPM domain-containing protein [Clostridia bacterium]|nr:TPM domain-containing protein [Clostridia bacterium]